MNSWDRIEGLKLIPVSVLLIGVVLGRPGYSVAEEGPTLPAGFENVFIGMTTADFRSARQSAVKLGRKSKTFTESLADHSIFNSVQYFFRDHHLICTFFAGVGMGKSELLSRSELLIDWAVETWGADFERQIERLPMGSRTFLLPRLVWKKGQVVMAITCPSAPKAYGMIFVRVYLSGVHRVEDGEVDPVEWTRAQVSQQELEERFDARPFLRIKEAAERARGRDEKRKGKTEK